MGEAVSLEKPTMCHIYISFYTMVEVNSIHHLTFIFMCFLLDAHKNTVSIRLLLFLFIYFLEREREREFDSFS